MDCACLFAFRFHINSSAAKTNKHNARARLLSFEHARLGNPNPSKNHVFSKSFPGPQSSNCPLTFFEKDRFGDPFKIQWAPKSADTSRCQALSNRRMQYQLKQPEPELSGLTWIMAFSKISSFLLLFSWCLDFGLPQSCFFSCWNRLLPARKNIKITSWPKSIKISKNQTLDAIGFNFDAILMSFGSLFSIHLTAQIS